LKLPVDNISRVGFCDCYENNIRLICSWVNRGWEYMFANRLIIPFKQVDSSGQSFNYVAKDNRHSLSLIEQFHGVRFYSNEFEGMTSVLEAIETDIQRGRIMLALVQSFWLPWDMYYRKNTRNLHFFVINGIDRGAGVLHCSDAYYDKQDMVLPIESFNKGFIRMIQYELHDEPRDQTYTLNPQHLENTLDETVASILNFRAFMKVYDIKKHLSEFTPRTVWRSPFLSHLEYDIVQGRRQFAFFLKFLLKEASIPNVQPVLKQFENLASEWMIIKSLFIKQYFSENSERFHGSIHERLGNIIDHERTAVNLLIEVLQQKEPPIMVPKKSEIQADLSGNENNNEEYFFLDLVPFLNNIAFQTGNRTGKADISGTGEFLEVAEDCFDEPLQTDSCRFQTSISDVGNSFDNISCQGQTIKLSLMSPKDSLMIMGCAEYGDFTVPIKVTYSDHETDYPDFRFTDWVHDTHIPEGAGIVLSGESYRKTEGTEFRMGKRNIIAVTQNLKRNAGIAEIQLPNCPNIHIFAMTLL